MEVTSLSNGFWWGKKQPQKASSAQPMCKVKCRHRHSNKPLPHMTGAECLCCVKAILTQSKLGFITPSCQHKTVQCCHLERKKHSAHAHKHSHWSLLAHTGLIWSVHLHAFSLTLPIPTSLLTLNCSSVSSSGLFTTLPTSFSSYFCASPPILHLYLASPHNFPLPFPFMSLPPRIYPSMAEWSCCESSLMATSCHWKWMDHMASVSLSVGQFVCALVCGLRRRWRCDGDKRLCLGKV